MRKMVVIDDDEDARRSIEQTLERAGYDVFTATEGESGIALVRSMRPDLVITDIVMPGREGLETIRTIRKEFRGLPIIAVSGGGRVEGTEYLAAARLLGANEAFDKPFLPSELVALVQGLLSSTGT